MITVRRKGEYERRSANWYVVAPGNPLLDGAGLHYVHLSPDWVPHRWNYSEEQYNRQVKAVDRYLRFSGNFWEMEPDQEVFEAFCLLMAREWEEGYKRWYLRQQAPHLVPNPEPPAMPLGTCRMLYNEQDPEASTWLLTPRTYDGEWPGRPNPFQQ